MGTRLADSATPGKLPIVPDLPALIGVHLRPSAVKIVSWLPCSPLPHLAQLRAINNGLVELKSAILPKASRGCADVVRESP